MSFYGFRFHHLNGRVYVVSVESNFGVADFETKDKAVAYVREVAERRAVFNRALREFDNYRPPKHPPPPGTKRDSRGRYVRTSSTGATVNKNEHERSEG